MENKIPKAAIIVANKNYGHYIKDAIQSAVLQDYPNKILYIVDDASEDNSLEIIWEDTNYIIHEENEDYILSYEGGKLPCRTFLFRLKQSGGPSRARNFAIKHAIENGAHIIAILDADDYWKQFKLSKSIIEIMKDPEKIGGVYSDYLIHNVETGAITYECKWAYDLNKLRQQSIVHSGAVLNVLALQQYGLYDESMRVCEDFHLWRRIGQKFIFIHLPLDLVVVRIQPQNSTLTVDKSIWEENYRKAISIPL